MKEYIAGWDGGGTKTICEVRELAGGETLRFTAGPLNPNGTVPGQADASAAGLLAQMAALPGGLAGCRMLCVGAAGISNPATEQRLRAALEQGGYDGPVCFTGDQQTALYGALGGAGGMVLIAGTGSICYGQTLAGEEARAGGWGSLMDDEGGGYALGRDILAAVVRGFDGRGPATCLKELVFGRLGVGDIQGMIGRIYAPGVGKREIAALAPLLSAALEQGDAAARQICEKAGRELAMLVLPVAARLGLQNARAALAGSVLAKCPPVRQGVCAALKSELPGLRCVSPQNDAASGAVLIARRALLQKK